MQKSLVSQTKFYTSKAKLSGRFDDDMEELDWFLKMTPNHQINIEIHPPIH